MGDTCTKTRHYYIIRNLKMNCGITSTMFVRKSMCNFSTSIPLTPIRWASNAIFFTSTPLNSYGHNHAFKGRPLTYFSLLASISHPSGCSHTFIGETLWKFLYYVSLTPMCFQRHICERTSNAIFSSNGHLTLMWVNTQLYGWIFDSIFSIGLSLTLKWI